MIKIAKKRPLPFFVLFPGQATGGLPSIDELKQEKSLADILKPADLIIKSVAITALGKDLAEKAFEAKPKELRERTLFAHIDMYRRMTLTWLAMLNMPANNGKTLDEYISNQRILPYFSGDSLGGQIAAYLGGVIIETKPQSGRITTNQVLRIGKGAAAIIERGSLMDEVPTDIGGMVAIIGPDLETSRRLCKAANKQYRKEYGRKPEYKLEIVKANSDVIHIAAGELALLEICESTVKKAAGKIRQKQPEADFVMKTKILNNRPFHYEELMKSVKEGLEKHYEDPEHTIPDLLFGRYISNTRKFSTQSGSGMAKDTIRCPSNTVWVYENSEQHGYSTVNYLWKSGLRRKRGVRDIVLFTDSMKSWFDGSFGGTPIRMNIHVVNSLESAVNTAQALMEKADALSEKPNKIYVTTPSQQPLHKPLY